MDFSRNQLNAALYYLRLGITPIPLCTLANGAGGCEQHGLLCLHPGKRLLVKGYAHRDVTEKDILEWWQVFFLCAGVYLVIIISGKNVESAGMATSRATCTKSVIRKGMMPR